MIAGDKVAGSDSLITCISLPKISAYFSKWFANQFASIIHLRLKSKLFAVRSVRSLGLLL